MVLGRSIVNQHDNTDGFQVSHDNRGATPIVESCKVCRNQNRKQRKTRKNCLVCDINLYAIISHYPKPHVVLVKINENIS